MNREERRKARKRKRRRNGKRRAISALQRDNASLRQRIEQFRFQCDEQSRYIKQIEDSAIRAAVDLAYTRAALRLAQMRADEGQIRALEAERQTQEMASELAAWRRRARGAERAQA